MPQPNAYQLIVAIVSQGRATPLVTAAKAAGAEGATIIRGRGTGVHESARFLGVPIEPEKDVLLVLIPRTQTNDVLDAMVRAGKLAEPGQGIAFVVDVPRVEGIAHKGAVVTSIGD
jgi:nitrogen regulatory protein P-II 1